MKRYLAVALGVLLLAAPGAFAQIRTGNIYGNVADAQGGVLPGVDVTLSGEVGTRTTVTSRRGRVPLPGPRQRPLHAHRSPSPASRTRDREVVVTTGENVEPRLRACKVAGVQETVEVMAETPARRHQEARHLDHDDHRRAAEGAERPRPVGRARERPRRAARPRQHRRQRERPAGQRRRQGHRSSARQDVEHRRPRRHRHVRDRRARRPTSTSTPSRRSRSPPAAPTCRSQAGRHRHQPRDQARHQHASTAAAASSSPTTTCSRQPARRPRRRPAPREPRRELPRQGRPHPADQRLRLRPRRPDPQGQAVVLRELGQAGHPPGPPDRRPPTRRC